MAVVDDTTVRILSDAAGRMRVHVPWVRSDSRRAVAVEETVDMQTGVRAVHAYPHTGSVVVWYSPKRCDRLAIVAAISAAKHVAAELIPARTPRSADVRNTEVLRLAIGGPHWCCWVCAATVSDARPFWAPKLSWWPPVRRCSWAIRSSAGRCVLVAWAPTRW
ncbi:putative metal cation-transporting P-type ATPase C ctpC [Mycobacterium kansasii 732]|nr:putative metal cation-transporting P-type ATPase C ctpC [Mycobacterium kansasii 732]